MTTLRTLPALNDNYSPARPWACMAPGAHECDGQVIGAHGAYPVCAQGVAVAQAQEDAIMADVAALMASPRFQREAAWERRMMARHA